MPFKKGHKVSEERKKMLSELMIGEGNPFYGKTHTEESKKKQSKAHLGFKPSKESIEKRKMTIAKR